jgi:hypothetical protein
MDDPRTLRRLPTSETVMKRLAPVVALLVLALAPVAPVASAQEPVTDPAFLAGVKLAELHHGAHPGDLTVQYGVPEGASSSARAWGDATAHVIRVRPGALVNTGPVDRCNLGVHEATHIHGWTHPDDGLPPNNVYTLLDTPLWQSSPYCEAFRDRLMERQSDRAQGHVWHLQDRVLALREKVRRLRRLVKRVRRAHATATEGRPHHL